MKRFALACLLILAFADFSFAWRCHCRPCKPCPVVVVEPNKEEEEGEQAAPKVEAIIPFKYRMYRDAKGEWRWRLQAANNRIIADSGEGYKNKSDCKRGIDLIRYNASTAKIVEQ